jgi:TRAP-type uncharacterized transport system fused permease subunit
MFVPIFVLVWLLMEQYTPLYAAFYSLLTTWVLSLIRKDTRLGPSKLLPMAVASARSCISLSVAMANAGFIVAVLSMSGIGMILADNIVELSQGSLFITLVLCMVVAIILGMGLPTSACYIIAASIAIPILHEFKVAGLQAHMFVFYYSCLSTVTPPVALASYVAAGLCGAKVNEVGWAAFKLALAGFIVPFFFIYSPAMLLVADSNLVIFWSFITGIAGTLLLAIAVEGYLYIPINWILRGAFFIAALTLIYPGLVTDIIGFILGVLGFGCVIYMKKKSQIT